MNVSVVPPRGTQFAIDLTDSVGLIAITGVLDGQAVDTTDECLVLATSARRRAVVVDLTGITLLGERALVRLEGVISASRRRGADIDIEATPGCLAHHALDAVSFVLRPRPHPPTPALAHPSTRRVAAASVSRPTHLRLVPPADPAGA